MRETIEHKDGQTFENHLEFNNKTTAQKLILVKSTLKLYPGQITLMEFEDPQYFSKNHWFVLYGNKGDTPENMGLVRLGYPKATRAITQKAATSYFFKMVDGQEFVRYEKFKKNG